ncbi:hypothetical protein [Porphyrobacter sp. YT40]|uniref:hypothetical protein n=1 Tax=Porphyrobacter sp. YT40 TaxID=2547601 RepID=UPI0011439D04|nr:hypothetical protein [Porphyrobacter sp. YT40]QDH34847.1 hypothetical protein E2E27_11245 [Porphyrobacter sp. YT40]
MNPDLLLPIITSLGWLILAGVGLRSRQLGLGQMVKMALAWILIFGGLFLVVEWFMVARGTASGLM